MMKRMRTRPPSQSGCVGPAQSTSHGSQRVDQDRPGDNVGLNIKGPDKNNIPLSEMKTKLDHMLVPTKTRLLREMSWEERDEDLDG